MLAIIGLYLLIVAVVLVVVMFRQHASGECELLSVRNIAVVGFILFQLTSASMSLFNNDFGVYSLNRPLGTAVEYAAMATVFLLIAFWAYRRGWGATTLARRVPTTQRIPNDTGMLVMAALMVGLAAFLRVGGLSQVAFIGLVAGDVATGIAAVSAGLAGWVWAKRFMNPAVACVTVLITVADMLIVMSGTFGRRDLVAVGAALVWGMYFSHWREVPIRLLLRRLALVAAGPIVVVALFSSARAAGQYDRTAAEQVRAILTGGKLGEGILDLLGGQACAAGSMWLLETHRDDTFPTRHLLSIEFFLVYPIPRALWEDKPTPIGNLMPSMALMQGVERDKFNIGPGIIGSAACEGGWYALIIYAVLSGLFLRFFDEAIRLNPHSPFVILSLGSALGHILGMARGETSSFAAITVITVSGALFIMVIIGKLLDSVTAGGATVRAVDDMEEWDEEAAADEDAMVEPELAAAYGSDQPQSERA